MKDFSEKIRTLKARQGLTGQRLSELSGVPLGTLNKLLTGVIEEPRLSTAEALCHALGTTLAALTEDGGLGAALPPDERKLLADYRAADEYGKVLVRTVAEMESSRTADSAESEHERSVRPAAACRALWRSAKAKKGS